MTRKQLVNGLRALHEDTEIDSIRTNKRTKAVEIMFGTTGLLILSYATEQRLQTKPK